MEKNSGTVLLIMSMILQLLWEFIEAMRKKGELICWQLIEIYAKKMGCA
jgi:hypothetical protein